MAELRQTIGRCRMAVYDEKRAQVELSEYLTSQGVQHIREMTLGPGDVVDFLISGIAVELKVKGSRMAIYRQLERYAAHGIVRGVILVTNRAMGLPETINGKPATVISMSRAWL